MKAGSRDHWLFLFSFFFFSSSFLLLFHHSPESPQLVALSYGLSSFSSVLIHNIFLLYYVDTFVTVSLSQQSSTGVIFTGSLLSLSPFPLGLPDKRIRLLLGPDHLSHLELGQ